MCNQLANKLIELRLDKDYTQFDLGRILNIADKTISAYETGKRKPSLKVLKKYSQEFDFPYEELKQYKVANKYMVLDYYDFLEKTNWKEGQLEDLFFDPEFGFNSDYDFDSTIDGTPEQWTTLTGLCPSLCKVVFDSEAHAKSNKVENHILGYWQGLFITDDFYEKFCNGDVVDAEITSDDVIPELSAGKEVKMFAAAVFKNNSTLVTTLLFKSFLDILVSMARTKEPTYITHVCAGPSTAGGERACRIIGLTSNKTKQTKTNNNIFVGTYSPPFDQHHFFRKHPALIDLYSNL